jgi:hypothetical protein
MNWVRLVIAIAALSLIGCGIGRIVTAPVRYVFHEPEPAPASNSSDVTNPGEPVRTTPTPSPRVASRKRAGKPATKTKMVGVSPSPAAQFPVAKSVPGKPGLVFNPFNPSGGYIDVSGYASGSKVKDPDSQKIFVVP